MVSLYLSRQDSAPLCPCHYCSSVHGRQSPAIYPVPVIPIYKYNQEAGCRCLTWSPSISCLNRNPCPGEIQFGQTALISQPKCPVLHYLLEFAHIHVHCVGDAIYLISSSCFSFCLQSFLASGSFPMSWLLCLTVCLYHTILIIATLQHILK